MTAARVCAGCGVELPPPKKYGRRLKWCSEQCRKQTLYGGTCEDCGAPTNGTNGRGPNAPRVCGDCRRDRFVAANARRWRQHRELIEHLWGEGKTAREIGETVGRNAPNIAALRALGYDLPHRRTPEQLARMAVGTDERMAKARAAKRKAAA